MRPNHFYRLLMVRSKLALLEAFKDIEKKRDWDHGYRHAVRGKGKDPFDHRDPDCRDDDRCYEVGYKSGRARKTGERGPIHFGPRSSDKKKPKERKPQEPLDVIKVRGFNKRGAEVTLDLKVRRIEDDGDIHVLYKGKPYTFSPTNQTVKGWGVSRTRSGYPVTLLSGAEKVEKVEEPPKPKPESLPDFMETYDDPNRDKFTVDYDLLGEKLGLTKDVVIELKRRDDDHQQHSTPSSAFDDLVDNIASTIVHSKQFRISTNVDRFAKADDVWRDLSDDDVDALQGLASKAVIGAINKTPEIVRESAHRKAMNQWTDRMRSSTTNTLADLNIRCVAKRLHVMQKSDDGYAGFATWDDEISMMEEGSRGLADLVRDVNGDLAKYESPAEYQAARQAVRAARTLFHETLHATVHGDVEHDDRRQLMTIERYGTEAGRTIEEAMVSLMEDDEELIGRWADHMGLHPDNVKLIKQGAREAMNIVNRGVEGKEGGGGPITKAVSYRRERIILTKLLNIAGSNHRDFFVAERKNSGVGKGSITTLVDLISERVNPTGSIASKFYNVRQRSSGKGWVGPEGWGVYSTREEAEKAANTAFRAALTDEVVLALESKEITGGLKRLVGQAEKLPKRKISEPAETEIQLYSGRFKPAGYWKQTFTHKQGERAAIDAYQNRTGANYSTAKKALERAHKKAERERLKPSKDEILMHFLHGPDRAVEWYTQRHKDVAKSAAKRRVNAAVNKIISNMGDDARPNDEELEFFREGRRLKAAMRYAKRLNSSLPDWAEDLSLRKGDIRTEFAKSALKYWSGQV